MLFLPKSAASINKRRCFWSNHSFWIVFQRYSLRIKVKFTLKILIMQSAMGGWGMGGGAMGGDEMQSERGRKLEIHSTINSISSANLTA